MMDVSLCSIPCELLKSVAKRGASPMTVAAMIREVVLQRRISGGAARLYRDDTFGALSVAKLRQAIGGVREHDSASR